jgi:ABC-2 type transport system ATP-binding protein
VHAGYGSIKILHGVSLHVNEGEVVSVIGPNGAGKSTTIGLLLGLLRATSGSASVFGLDVGKDAVAVHRRLAYVPSDASLWPTLTGAEALQLLGNLHGSVDTTFRSELLERFALDPEKKVRADSHGTRQKVLLVAACSSRADLLLLDEPTSGLDPLMERVFQECVREARDRGQTVLLSSHVLSEVEAVCDRVAMLRAGRLVEVGRLDRLRELSALHVRAQLTSAVPDVSSVPGVRRIAVDGNQLECEVTGPVQPLLEVLTAAGVERLETREPSLEELFLAHYGAP